LGKKGGPRGEEGESTFPMCRKKLSKHKRERKKKVVL